MADYDTFMFYAGTYTSVESAEADYQAVKDLHYELDLIDTFDAAGRDSASGPGEYDLG